MSSSTATEIIKSLTSEKAIEIILANGPEHAHKIIRLKNDVHEGRAWQAQEQAFKDLQKALPKIFEKIEPREIKVVNQAFNDSPEHSRFFQNAALGALPLAVLAVAAAIRAVGSSLEGVQSELAISNVAKVQGWGTGGFGSYVHLFVRNEMNSTTLGQDQSASTQPHFFYVWHPDTDWYPAFEEKQARNPLGSTFGGYSHDLATICLRMRADREVLIRTTSFGRTAIFHLIIPAYSPIVLDKPFVFADALLPLAVTGTRHRGADLVWFELWLVQKKLQLNQIGLLETTRKALSLYPSLISCAGVIATVGAGFASAVFPPFAPILAPALPSMMVGIWSFGAVGMTSMIYEDLTREGAHVLGHAVFLEQ